MSPNSQLHCSIGTRRMAAKADRNAGACLWWVRRDPSPDVREIAIRADAAAGRCTLWGAMDSDPLVREIAREAMERLLDERPDDGN